MNKPVQKAARKSKLAKQPRPMVMEITNAPPATFLSFLTLPMNSLSVSIEAIHKDREDLAGLSTGEIEKRIWRGLLELAHRIKHPHNTSKGVENGAADGLAAMAIGATNLLRQLALSSDREHKEKIGFAARSKHSWPVVLRLGVKRDKNGKRCLLGADDAWSYLNAIELSKDAGFAVQHFGDAEASVFKRAAELLLDSLIRWREQGAWQGEVSTWNKDLLLLELPFTKENAGEWWSVAKRWMDEQWKSNPELFAPLIGASKSKGVALDSPRCELYRCEVRKHVIDLNLRKEFHRLPKTDL